MLEGMNKDKLPLKEIGIHISKKQGCKKGYIRLIQTLR